MKLTTGGSSGGQAAESASASELSKLPTIAGESAKPADSATKVADDKKDKLGLAVSLNNWFKKSQQDTVDLIPQSWNIL